jgi:hypothetical protein
MNIVCTYSTIMCFRRATTVEACQHIAGVQDSPLPRLILPKNAVIKLFWPAVLALLSAAANAQVPPVDSANNWSVEQIEFFERHVRPVLVEHCYACHNSRNKSEGGLKLDHRDGLLQGGDRGPAIVPGKADESLLIRVLRHEEMDLRMPAGGPKLTPEVVADLTRWIDQGAVDPRDQAPTAKELEQVTSWEAVRERRKTWWSFQPLCAVRPPCADPRWRHPVDRFLAVRWKGANIESVETADKRTLIRRVTFALIGLPPSPEEAKRFLADQAPDAYERVVDRLLDSPRFGERWARHWMDWFRYAETHGSEGDPAIAHAWRYRDYLIRALNGDVPYNQLVREHVAGDLLANPRTNAELGINESALGIGHFRMVHHGYVPTDPHDEQVRFTDNQIDTLSKAFLGLTLSCARCHHHKFDPLSQHDFYAWYGILASCRPAVVTVDTPGRDRRHRDELLLLKQAIKTGVAKVWESSIETFADQLRNAPRPVASGEQERNIETVPSNSWQSALTEAIVSEERSPLFPWVALEGKYGDELEREWRRLAAKSDARVKAAAAFRAATVNPKWDLRREDCLTWFAHGLGLTERRTLAGEFHVLPDGPQVLSNIYPSGVYTHLLSNKHNGVLESPRFTIDCDEICVRVAGDGSSRVRYVVRNYVRALLTYPSANPNHESAQWYRWDAKYWKGEEAHIEIATANDLPTDNPADKDRSWFGILEVAGRNVDEPQPVELGAALFPLVDPQTATPRSADEMARIYKEVLRACVHAWLVDSLSDEQAEFLGFFVQRKLLPNTLDELPEVAELVFKYRRLEGELSIPTRAPGIHEATPLDQPLFIRGDHRQPGEVVARLSCPSVHRAGPIRRATDIATMVDQGTGALPGNIASISIEQPSAAAIGRD